MGAIGFVPARGGSKSIPLKNIKHIGGKPLIYWSLSSLNDSTEVDKVVLATDSDEIERVARSFKLPKLEIYRRSPDNAADTSSTESVMLEYLHHSKPAPNDYFILAQATNPFFTAEDISKSLSLLTGKHDSLLSCVRVKRFIWDESGKPVNYDYNNRPRRQDFGGHLVENGAFYINTVKNILEHKNRLSGDIAVYEMPEYSYFELDEEHDWIIMENLLKVYRPLALSSTPDIKLLLTDVDGVLTDGGMYYSEHGDELKRFCTYDGYAFELLRKRGIRSGIITGEDRQLNERRKEKLNIDFIFQGIKDKLQVASNLCDELGITLAQVAYIGDDHNDIELLKHVGIAACPENADPKVKRIPNILHLKKRGGEGVLREFIEQIFQE